MKIHAINAYVVKLPLKGEFSTSKQKRTFSETVIVELVGDDDSLKGYGESLPVQFVTGETPQSVMETIKSLVSHELFPKYLDTAQQVFDFVNSLPLNSKTNDATCAIEIALLDLLGHYEGKPIVDYFDKTFFTPKIHYGAIIPLGRKDMVIQFCKKIRSLGLRQIRVKMGKDFPQNKETLELVRNILGDSCELTIDPNAVWDRDLAFRHFPLLKDLKVKTVEEPMPREAEGFEDFAKALGNSNIQLMACESAITFADVKRIVYEKMYQVINVKLSRNGGFHRCLKIIDFIRKNALFFRIGCGVGESGVLSAAGRTLGLLCKDALCYDGSYDEHIILQNVTTQNIGFGFGGEAGPLSGTGLGVQIDPHCLKSLSESSFSITL